MFVLKSKYREALKKIEALNYRLSQAVEGFTCKEREILRAKKAGNYIYSVYKGEQFIRKVLVPISETRKGGYYAKLAAGFKKSEMKGLKAVRWEI